MKVSSYKYKQINTAKNRVRVEAGQEMIEKKVGVKESDYR